MIYIDMKIAQEWKELVSQIAEHLRASKLPVSLSRDGTGIDVGHFGYRVTVNPENKKITAYRYTGRNTKYHSYSLADPDCFGKIIHAIKNRL